MARNSRPLFRPDPGWLFIIAGLTLCAAGILLPAQFGLQALRRQLALLQQEEDLAYARLKAHLDFLDDFDRGDSALVRRMAATQLNLMPAGDVPVLLAARRPMAPTDWIDATVRVDPRPPEPTRDSTLSRWATGRDRLWLFAAGAFSVFVGLLLDPAKPFRRRLMPVAGPDEIRRVAEAAGFSGAGIVEAETRWQAAAQRAGLSSAALPVIERGNGQPIRPDEGIDSNRPVMEVRTHEELDAGLELRMAECGTVEDGAPVCQATFAAEEPGCGVAGFRHGDSTEVVQPVYARAAQREPAPADSMDSDDSRGAGGGGSAGGAGGAGDTGGSGVCGAAAESDHGPTLWDCPGPRPDEAPGSDRASTL
jgi:hypothetical protein